jgi:hypothetical protein
MRVFNNIFMTLSHAFLFLMLLVSGVFCVNLYYSKSLCYLFVQSLLYNNQLFLSVGVILLLITLALLVGLCFFHRKRFLKIKMMPFDFSVDRDVVKQYIQQYCHSICDDIMSDVVIRKNNCLEVFISKVPVIEGIDKTGVFKKIEKEIRQDLFNKFNYNKEIVVSFATNNKIEV